MSALPLPAGDASEANLAARWSAGLDGPLRVADGRALRVVFPGVPGLGAGPDFVDAQLEIGGDLLRGAVEIHLRASGWRTHGHHHDPAYAGVVLHVVGADDVGALATLHRSGRAIPVLVIPPSGDLPAPSFIPPCTLAVARGLDPAATLGRLGLRRLRSKGARVGPLVASHGPEQALYALLLETCGGPANREPFAAVARRLPLAALLERAACGPDRALVATAELRGALARLVLRRAGLRPMASPARRVEVAGRLVARLWPTASPAWPASLNPACGWRPFAVEGGGRGLAVELAVNALLPVALASGLWSEAEVAAEASDLPTPGTYGKLRRLESWLGPASQPRPFTSAASLQGGLLLHGDYCSRGRCGRCPLSS